MTNMTYNRADLDKPEVIAQLRNELELIAQAHDAVVTRGSGTETVNGEGWYVKVYPKENELAYSGLGYNCSVVIALRDLLNKIV